MSLRCIIIEDQPPAQRILQKFIIDAGGFDLLGVFSDALSATPLLKTNHVDLMFLDIHLPKITGLDFLKSLHHRPHVILTTAFSEYALEGYELNVVDYLLKPFSFERFLQAVNKVPQNTQSLGRVDSNDKKSGLNDIYIKTGHDYIKVIIDDIISIRSDSDYTEIQYGDNKVLSNEPLKHWLVVLDSSKFLQLHKSFIINLTKVDRITGNKVHLNNGTVVPIGRAFKEEFMNRLLT
ncbi:MAG: response regulator transcription factor [Bacteroidota bacterium]